MHLTKYLQAQGIGSKKQCQRLILNEAVSLNGETFRQPLDEIMPENIQTLKIYDVIIDLVPLPYFYLLLHKPADYETSNKPHSYPSIFSLLPENIRNLEPQAVGRLDADTTGLLLITNDGQFNHRMTSPKHAIHKIYQVTLKHAADETLCQKLLNGVVLNDSPNPVFAIDAKLTDEKTLLLTINEGRYHQIKRMIAAVSNRVEFLHRIQFGPFSIEDTKLGEWRWVTPEI